MITFTDTRTKPEGYSSQSTRTMKSSKAFDILANCELAFGGKIEVVFPTRVETKTVVLGAVDHSIFEGSVEDMCYLFELAQATRTARELLKHPERKPDDGSLQDIHRMMGALKSGTGATKIAAISILGVENEEEMCDKLTELPLEDIVAVIGLLADGEATREEALSLI